MDAQVVGKVGGQMADQLLRPHFGAAGAQGRKAAFGDDEPDLELAVGGGEDDGGALGCHLDLGRRPIGIAVGVRDLEPEDVVVLRGGDFGEATVFARRRVTAVGAHDEIGPVLARSVIGVGADADHAAVLAQEVAHGDAAVEAEGRVLPCLIGQHLEQCRLRHEARLPPAKPGRVGADA